MTRDELLNCADEVASHFYPLGSIDHLPTHGMTLEENARVYAEVVKLRKAIDNFSRNTRHILAPEVAEVSNR